jgi:hypothetical protein
MSRMDEGSYFTYIMASRSHTHDWYDYEPADYRRGSTAWKSKREQPQILRRGAPQDDNAGGGSAFRLGWQ